MDMIERAVSVLMHDGLIVYPTDTIYGLGADAFSEEAIEKVYEAKKRDLAKPISIAVSDFEMLAAVSRIDSPMEEFIRKFLPGPVTVVVPARKDDSRYPDRGHWPYRHPHPGARHCPAGHRTVRCAHNCNECKPLRGKRSPDPGRVHGAPRSSYRWGKTARDAKHGCGSYHKNDHTPWCECGNDRSVPVDPANKEAVYAADPSSRFCGRSRRLDLCGLHLRQRNKRRVRAPLCPGR